MHVPMPRFFTAALIVTAALLTMSATAEAQMTWSVSAIGDRGTSSLTAPFNKKECEQDVSVDLLFNNVPTSSAGSMYVDFWYGLGASQSCLDPTTRNNAPGVTQCIYEFEEMSNNATMLTFTTTVSKLVPCTSGQYTVWALAVQSMKDETALSSPEVGISQTFTVDASPPNAPTNVTTGSGNTAVPLLWTIPANDDLSGYEVIIQAIADASDTSCATATLVQGADVASDALVAATLMGGGATSVNIDPSQFGVPVGGYAAVAVVSKDLAGNVSVLSQVACLHRVPTNGFWAEYQQNGGNAKTCSVVAPGASSSRHGGWLAILGVAAAVSFLARRKKNQLASAAILVAVLGASTGVKAQDLLLDDYRDRPQVQSPEKYAIEFRVGGFQPRVGNPAFVEVFGNSSRGPLFAGEFDLVIYRIPVIGTISAGLGFGYAGYVANAYDQNNSSRVSELTHLRLMPASLLAVLRVDTLARKFGAPFVFTGKLGMDATYWTTSTGTSTDASGLSLGLRWGAQLGFELDFFDRAGARALDEQWGLNHAFLFIEAIGVFGVGPRQLLTNAIGWAAGMGFNF